MRKLPVRKAVFPLRGLGARLRPITNVVGKELLPIGAKALIHFAVQEAIDSGIQEIHFVVKPGDHVDYFAPQEGPATDSPDLHDARGLQPIPELLKRARFFTHSPQSSLGGFGGTVLAAEPYVAGEPFALVLPDDFIDGQEPCLRLVIDAYQSVGLAVIAVTPIARKEISEFGVVRYERLGGGLYRIRKALEKPPPASVTWPAMGIVGRYVLNPSIFDALRLHASRQRTTAIELTPAVDIVARVESAYGVRFQGHYIHAGTELGYLKAVVYYALRRSKYAPAIRRQVRRLLDAEPENRLQAARRAPKGTEHDS